VEWFKVKVLSSKSSTTKKILKRLFGDNISRALKVDAESLVPAA
jgi:hypothetical protein